MADPFLEAHRIAPATFSIAGRLHPISIRDQVIRGQLFVLRAIREGLIRRSADDATDVPPFLVVGAGVAGTTAAIAAADQRVRTILIERTPQAFATQAFCTTRWIDPTQYDWPMGHWQVGRYPWDPALVRPPLPWNASDYAHNLAAVWQQILATRSVQGAATPPPSSHLWYRPRVVLKNVLRSPVNPNRAVVAQLLDQANNIRTSVSASAILIATGFGRECCSLETQYHRLAPARHPTEGISFWADDDLAKPGFGLGHLPVRVLISGAGDGALQDFLRVVTDPAQVRSAGEILGLLQVPFTAWSEIQDAQDQVDRQGNWGTRDDDHGPLEYLQRTIDSVVSSLLADPGLCVRIASVLRAPTPEVYLVYNCSHFGRGYALNRFLALLLIGYLQRHGPARTVGPPLLNPHHRVVNLDPVSPHVCGAAPACYGRGHTFELAQTTSCADDTPLGSGASGQADILVLHHGPRLDGIPKRLLRLYSPPLARQLLPYGLIA